MQMIQKRTVDLKPGDVVHFADLIDTVVYVTNANDSASTVEVYATRNNKLSWWTAGIDSVQDVEAPDEG